MSSCTHDVLYLYTYTLCYIYIHIYVYVYIPKIGWFKRQNVQICDFIRRSSSEGNKSQILGFQQLCSLRSAMGPWKPWVRERLWWHRRASEVFLHNGVLNVGTARVGWVILVSLYLLLWMKEHASSHQSIVFAEALPRKYVVMFTQNWWR